jgi:hypothetical protein
MHKKEKIMSPKRFDSRSTLCATLSLLGAVLGASYGKAAGADAPAGKPQVPAESGWQKVMARKGGCALYVPGDWKADALVKGSAGTDDNSASAVVSLADSASGLAQVKSVMQANFAPTKTFEDTPHRLWYEYQLNGHTNWYVGVPVKGGICGAQITFKPGKEAIATKIAASVGAGF